MITVVTILLFGCCASQSSQKTDTLKADSITMPVCEQRPEHDSIQEHVYPAFKSKSELLQHWGEPDSKTDSTWTYRLPPRGIKEKLIIYTFTFRGDSITNVDRREKQTGRYYRPR